MSQQDGGKIEGGQVFIFSKDIKNNGKIISSGTGAKTHLETEKYSGTGSVESHSQAISRNSWTMRNTNQVVVGLIVTIVGGLILYFVFGIK